MSRLGELLVARSLVSPEQLAEALEIQHYFGGRLGTNLVEMGLVTDEQIAVCLSDQFKLPYARAEEVGNIPAPVIGRVAGKIAARFRCIPVSMDGDTLLLASDDPLGLDSDELRRAVGMAIKRAVITEVTLNYALDRYYGIRREVRHLKPTAALRGYRWLSDAARTLFAQHDAMEIIESLPGLLAPMFRAHDIAVVHVRGKTLLVRRGGEDKEVPADGIPIERLREDVAPMVTGDKILAPIYDGGELRGVLSLTGFRPKPGDLDLLQALLEQCQHAFSNAAAAKARTQQQRIAESLGRYVPSRIAEQIAQNPDLLPLYARKQKLAVLFSDVRGFTAITERMDPDITVMMLNTYFTEMATVVRKHEGTVDKFIGDGLMAFWGAPVEMADFAVLAARAAQEMQRALPRVNRKLRRQEIEASLQIGIGICTGETLVGNVGTRDLLQYTAIGDVVNVASRLCSIAGPGEVLVDEQTAALIGGQVACTPIGPIHVKGRAQPVPVHRVQVEVDSAATAARLDARE